jgi:hypothetical protein
MFTEFLKKSIIKYLGTGPFKFSKAAAMYYAKNRG